MNLARKKISLFFLLLSVKLFAQIPINSFCEEKTVQIPSGFTKFDFLELNQDSLKDIFLYGNHQKEFAISYGKSDSTFEKPVKKFFFYPISDFKHFNNIPKLADYYIFISSSKRVAGLSSFNKDGSMLLINQITFDSYPGKLIVTDVDGDMKNDALIFGSNFNGLTLLVQNNFKLNKIDLFRNRIFSDAVLYDINYDDFPDLLAIDLVSNSIVVLINDERGGFKQTREIYFEENISNLKTCNFNKDFFDDISIVKENKLEILLGDSVSSFQNKIVFPINERLSNYCFGDFNHDEKNDFALISKKKNYLYLALQDSEHSENQILLKRNGVFTDIKSNNFGKNNLSVLNAKGTISFIRQVQLKDTLQLYFGDSTSSLFIGDINNDRIFDICYIDDFDNSLKIFLSDNKKVCKKLYNFPLIEKANKLKIFRIKKNKFLFSMFYKRNRLVEFIAYDFINDSLSKQILYSSAPIENILLLNKELLIVENDSSKLIVERFKYVNNEFIKKDSLFIADSYLNSFFFKRAGKLSLLFYKIKNDSLIFNEYNFNKLQTLKSYFTTKIDSIFFAGNLISGKPFVYESKHYIFTEFFSGSENIYLIFNGSELYRLNDKSVDTPLSNEGRKEINIYNDKLKNNSEIYISDYKLNNIFKVEINLTEKTIEFKPVYKSDTITKYFVGGYLKSRYIIVQDKPYSKLKLIKLNE